MSSHYCIEQSYSRVYRGCLSVVDFSVCGLVRTVGAGVSVDVAESGDLGFPGE